MINYFLLKQIKSRVNIVDVIATYLALTKKGSNYFALCPFHDDRNPSLSVNAAKQIFKCFTCQKAGDVITFLKSYPNLNFDATIKTLCQQLNMPFNETSFIPALSDNAQKILETNQLAVAHFSYNLINLWDDVNHPAAIYCKSRKLTKALIIKWNIGWALGNHELTRVLTQSNHNLINSYLTTSGKDIFRNRLMFSIYNQYDQVIGFAGRSIDNTSAKYLNTSQNELFTKSNCLYNVQNLTSGYVKSIILVEGFLDVIALTELGYPNTLALMGTNLSQAMIEYLKPLTSEIILWFDNDQPGKDATLHISALLLKNQFTVKVMNYEQHYHDPDQLWKATNDKLLIDQWFKNNLYFPAEWLLLVLDWNKNNINEFNHHLNQFWTILKLTNTIEQQIFIKKLSTLTELDQASLYHSFRQFDQTIMIEQPSKVIDIYEPCQLKLLKLSCLKKDCFLTIKRWNVIDIFSNIKCDWLWNIIKQQYTNNESLLSIDFDDLLLKNSDDDLQQLINLVRHTYVSSEVNYQIILNDLQRSLLNTTLATEYKQHLVDIINQLQQQDLSPQLKNELTVNQKLYAKKLKQVKKQFKRF